MDCRGEEDRKGRGDRRSLTEGRKYADKWTRNHNSV